MKKTRSWILRLGLGVLLLAHPSLAKDPLDEINGTEDWNTPTLDNDRIEQEQADLAEIQSMWQKVINDFSKEREIHYRLSKEATFKSSVLPSQQNVVPKPNQAERGTQPIDSAASSQMSPTLNVDRAIEAELEKSGAIPNLDIVPLVPLTPSRPTDKKPERNSLIPAIPSSGASSNPDSSGDQSMAPQNQDSVYQPDSMTGQESELGAKAAAKLLIFYEEEVPLEQEDLRNRSDLLVDSDGQVVDLELREEIEINN